MTFNSFDKRINIYSFIKPSLYKHHTEQWLHRMSLRPTLFLSSLHYSPWTPAVHKWKGLYKCINKTATLSDNWIKHSVFECGGKGEQNRISSDSEQMKVSERHEVK